MLKDAKTLKYRTRGVNHRVPSRRRTVLTHRRLILFVQVVVVSILSSFVHRATAQLATPKQAEQATAPPNVVLIVRLTCGPTHG